MPDAPMTEADLAEIEARCEAATPGPWHWENDNMMPPAQMAEWDPELNIAPRIIETDGGYYGPRVNDREFIAAARTDVPALIAALRRSWAENADLKAALAKTVEIAKAAMLAEGASDD